MRQSLRRELDPGRPRLIAALVPLLALAFVLSGCEERRRSNPFDPGNPDTSGEPPLLRAVAASAQVELSWDLVRFDGARATRLLRSSGADPELVLARFLGTGPGRHVDDLLPNGVTFTYRLEIEPIQGELLYTDSEAATPGGSRPWVADASGGGLIRLSPDGRDILFRAASYRSLLDLEMELDGSFWAADYSGGMVLHYGPGGESLFSWSVPGANTVAVERSSGQIWVGSFSRGEVSLYERSGFPVWSDSTVGLVEEIEAAAEGGIWVASREGGVSRVFPGSVLFRVPDIHWAVDIEVAPDGQAWIVEREQAKVYRVTPDGLILQVSPAVFDDPIDASGDGEGGLFVADRRRGGVIHLGPDMREVSFFPLGAVEAVTWDPASHRLWVCYRSEGRIEVARVVTEESGERAEVEVSLFVGGRPVKVEGIWRL